MVPAEEPEAPPWATVPRSEQTRPEEEEGKGTWLVVAVEVVVIRVSQKGPSLGEVGEGGWWSTWSLGRIRRARPNASQTDWEGPYPGCSDSANYTFYSPTMDSDQLFHIRNLFNQGQLRSIHSRTSMT